MLGAGKKFKSAVGPVFYCVMIFTFIITTLATIPAMEQTSTIEFITIIVSVLPVYILFPWMLFTTDYTVYQDELKIRCGPFRIRINRNDISSIKPSNIMMSGPALSMDRLAIFYGDGRTLLVSPEDKAGFYRAMEFDQQEERWK